MGKGGCRRASRTEEECGGGGFSVSAGREGFGRRVEWIHTALHLTTLPFKAEAGWKGDHSQQFRPR